MQAQAVAKFWEEHPEFDDIDTPELIVPPPANLAWIVDLMGLSDQDEKLLLDYIGISPDGIPGPEDGLETKVPSDKEVHLEYLAGGIVPPEHLAQCGISLLATGDERWWFVSYFPELEDEDKRYFETCLVREENEQYLIFMVAKILDFLRVHVAHGVFDTRPEESAEIVQGDDGFPIIAWGLTDAAIDILIADCDKLAAPTNDSEYQIVKSTKNAMVKRRTSTNAAYKKATARAKEYTDGAKQEEKRLIERMAPAEERLKEYCLAWESAIRVAKLKKETAETERVEALQARVDQFGLFADNLKGMKSDQIQEQIKRMRDLPVDDTFAEMEEDAQRAKESMLYRASEILTDVLGVEAETEAVARDKKRTDDEAAALKKRNDELEATQAKQAKIDAAKARIANFSTAAVEAMSADLERAQYILDKLHVVGLTDFLEVGLANEATDAWSKAESAVKNIVAQKLDQIVGAQKKADEEAEATKKQVVHTDRNAIAQSLPQEQEPVDAEIVEDEPDEVDDDLIRNMDIDRMIGFRDAILDLSEHGPQTLRGGEFQGMLETAHISLKQAAAYCDLEKWRK